MASHGVGGVDAPLDQTACRSVQLRRGRTPPIGRQGFAPKRTATVSTRGSTTRHRRFRDRIAPEVDGDARVRRPRPINRGCTYRCIGAMRPQLPTSPLAPRSLTGSSPLSVRSTRSHAPGSEGSDPERANSPLPPSKKRGGRGKLNPLRTLTYDPGSDGTSPSLRSGFPEIPHTDYRGVAEGIRPTPASATLDARSLSVRNIATRYCFPWFPS